MGSPVIFHRLRAFIKEYPIAKGMITYAVLWPTSNICQQAIRGRSPKEYDLQEAARFSVFGCTVVAPSIYMWVKVAGVILPGNTIRVAVTKALVEQVMYAPFGISVFYAGMTLLENKSLDEAIDEVKAKFWPTYRTGICFWPIFQTFNFAFVKERNRVPITSVASFFWTVFLSYMKQKQMEESKLITTAIGLKK